MLNIHIYPSPFTHESRILKEAATLSRRLGFTRILLVGVLAADLPAEERVDETTTIHRLGPAKGRGLAKVVRHLMWCLHVLRYCLKHRPDCVNCHSLPVLPIGVAVKLLTGARLVYDAHELETEAAGTRGLRQVLSRLVEKACLAAVDLLVVVSPGIESWYRERYGFTRTVTVLNAPAYRAPARQGNALRESLAIGEAETIVLYQGVLGSGRGVEELVAAAPLLRDAGYALVFMGYGPMADTLKAQAHTSGDFYFHPAVSPETLLTYTSSADIGVCLIQDSCLSYHLCLPNKLFEYIMAGLPVLASDLPEMRNVIEQGEVGTCIGAWDPPAVLDAVRQAAGMRGAGLRARLDRVARAHSWEVQEERLVAAYRDFVISRVNGSAKQ